MKPKVSGTDATKEQKEISREAVQNDKERKSQMDHLEKLLSYHRESQTFRIQRASVQKSEVPERSMGNTNYRESARQSARQERQLEHLEEKSDLQLITRLFSEKANNANARKLSVNDNLPPITRPSDMVHPFSEIDENGPETQ